jgi:hypothetical protein
LKKNGLGIYCALQDLLLENPFGAKSCLLKNSVVVVNYCDCFHAFVEGESFFGKDTDRLLVKILPGVSNVCNAYTNLRT